jgi:hypothetical protein
MRPEESPRSARVGVVASLALALLGCGGGAASGAGATTPAEVTGNDAVRARLAGLEALPLDPSTEIRAMTAEGSLAYCGWQTRALGAEDVQASCPDGSTVRIQAACDEEAMGAMRAGMLDCALTVGEWAACVAARRATPCEGGLFGETLPECEAFAGCIARAMQASQAEAQGAGSEPADE